jgi:hypothetical protein
VAQYGFESNIWQREASTNDSLGTANQHKFAID